MEIFINTILVELIDRRDQFSTKKITEEVQNKLGYFISKRLSKALYPTTTTKNNNIKDIDDSLDTPFNNKINVKKNQTTVLECETPHKPVTKSERDYENNKYSHTNLQSRNTYEMPIPQLSLEDVGGIDDIQDTIRLMFNTKKHMKDFCLSGVRGALLYGPQGSGKTLLANAIAGEMKFSFFPIISPELITGISGGTETNIRAVFSEAIAKAPSLIFFDDLEAIAGHRGTAEKAMGVRIVAQLCACIDSIPPDVDVFVLGATSFPSSIDQSLRCSGRLDNEFSLKVPNKRERVDILRKKTKDLPAHSNIDFESIANLTPGFVGGDLQALCNVAGSLAVKRLDLNQGICHGGYLESEGFQEETNEMNVHPLSNSVQSPKLKQSPKIENIENFNQPRIINMNGIAPGKKIPSVTIIYDSDTESASDFEVIILNENENENEEPKQFVNEDIEKKFQVTMTDYLEALKRIQPTLLREGFSPPTNITFDDIGALKKVKKQIHNSILLAINHSEMFEYFDTPPSNGILLYGPPGCGKTLLAKAVASQSGANFISVKGPELLDKFVGESERAVRDLFERAKTAQPCVIFFDELDALVPKRGNSNHSEVTDRVVNQFLTMLDGLDSRGSVFVIGATNRPLLVDNALLRPGRLGQKIFVPMPDRKDRESILKTHLKKKPQKNIDIKKIARLTEGFSGADIQHLVREAITITIVKHKDKFIAKRPVLKQKSFDKALKKIHPSVDPEIVKKYDEIRLILDQIDR
eukprot:TRINITY_DN2645_c0_g1_i1.p1 TRINITY_DN2645_c0_g1~~TRINITY_DN2645_c0_g1_i1.p1  ORF type:complete len:784 (-),score=199.56 TRINITY_DN2645_c0_g1_i1:155-2413(-)